MRRVVEQRRFVLMLGALLLGLLPGPVCLCCTGSVTRGVRADEMPPAMGAGCCAPISVAQAQPMGVARGAAKGAFRMAVLAPDPGAWAAALRAESTWRRPPDSSGNQRPAPPLVLRT